MITIVLGTIAFGSLSMGYFLCATTIYEWIIYALATIILFFPHVVTWALGMDLPTFIVDAVGVALWGVVYFMQKIRIRKNPDLTLPIEERRRKKKALSAGAH
jgi:TRAP-type uncharacterized transport system fused permease subunit